MPAVLEVMRTVTVQLALTGRVNPLILSDVAPLLRLLLLAPVQVPPAVWAPLTVMSVRVSVKLAPVSAVAFGLVSVKVMVEVPPETIGLVPNALAIVGRPSMTVESESVGLLLAPPPETPAVLTSGVEALAATFTVRVIGFPD